MNNDELLHNKLYEKTKDCGRTQFVKLLMGKEREIERLKSLIKCDYEDSQTIMAELTNENKHLKEQLQNKQDIINGILDYIDSNKFVEEFKNVVNERNVRNEILNRIEKSDK